MHELFFNNVVITSQHEDSCPLFFFSKILVKSVKHQKIIQKKCLREKKKIKISISSLATLRTFPNKKVAENFNRAKMIRRKHNIVPEKNHFPLDDTYLFCRERVGVRTRQGKQIFAQEYCTGWHRNNESNFKLKKACFFFGQSF